MTLLSAHGAEIAALVFGFAGQALFSARMLVQWLASERARRSVVPVSFWWLSLAGGLTLFLYAAYRRDPVFLLGQGAGLFVYWRNLLLIGRRPEPSHGHGGDGAGTALERRP